MNKPLRMRLQYHDDDHHQHHHYHHNFYPHDHPPQTCVVDQFVSHRFFACRISDRFVFASGVGNPMCASLQPAWHLKQVSALFGPLHWQLGAGNQSTRVPQLQVAETLKKRLET